MITILEIIIGRAGTGKTQNCLDQMKNFLHTEGLKAKIYLLMPAYMTYKTEWQFAEMNDSAVNTYVYSFQRFARQILTETNGLNIPKITEIGRRMILRKILLRRDKSQEFKYFARAVKQRGFSETLAETIKELRTYDITPDKLKNATSFDLDDDELTDKLNDLAMIEEDFLNEIDGKNYDDEDVIEIASEKIIDSKLCKEAEIFIDGFVFFDPLQRKIIRELLTTAKNIHIALPLDTNLNHKENDIEVGLFRQSMKTFIMLRQMADDLKIEMKITRCKNQKRFKRGALAMIEENLFDFSKRKIINKNSTDSLNIIEAANQRVEVEAVAQDILKIKQERNYKFRDFGILFRDEKYINLLKTALEQHDIPFFSDTPLLAIHHPLAELILSSLDTLSSRNSDSLFYCLRTGFFDVKQEDIDLLENYVIEFGIKGLKSWTRSDSWTFYRRNFDDDVDKIPDNEKKRINAVNEIRFKIIEPFKNFSEKLSDKKSLTVKKISEALFEFLEEMRVQQKLNLWSRKAALIENLTLAKEHQTIWNEVVKLLEQFVEIMGDEVITIKEFIMLMTEGIDAIEMSLIPQGLDEVTIANLNQNSLQNSKAIYIIGCNEGSMPRSSSEKGLFSDSDRLKLIENADLEIHAGQIENSLAEKFLLYRGFTEAQEYLCISYSLADSKGESIRKSPLIKSIQKIIPNVNFETKTIELLGSNSNLRFIVDDKKISTDIATQLFAKYNRTIKSSVSKIEIFMKCQFKHFAQFGLKLEERRERKFKALDLGNLLHSTLRKFGERMKSENDRRWSSVGNDELIKIVDEIFDEIVPRLSNSLLKSNETYKYQLQRIRNVAIRSLRRLIELDSVSKFHPEHFETTFGFTDGLKALSFDLENNFKIDLAGKIDRIDISENGKYFSIIDYKTGKAAINLLDLYYGLNLQLITYLLVANENLIDQMPAAMLYFLIKYPAQSDKKRMTEEEAKEFLESKLKMPGWILADKNVIEEIDKSLKFIKVSYKNDGDFTANTKPFIKTTEEFKYLLAYVGKIFQDAGNEIIDGNISVNPYEKDSEGNKICEYCPYKAVCGFDLLKQWTPFKKISDEEVMKLIKNEGNDQ